MSRFPHTFELPLTEVTGCFVKTLRIHLCGLSLLVATGPFE